MHSQKPKMMNTLKVATISIAIAALAGCMATPPKPYTYEHSGSESKLSKAECEKAKRDAALNNAMVEYIKKNKLANDPNWQGKLFTVPAECK